MGSRSGPDRQEALAVPAGPGRRGPPAHSRQTTIAVLLPTVASHDLWLGAAGAARARGVNLVCFAGRRLRDLVRFEAQANVAYDLVSTEQIQGLIVWASALGSCVGREELQGFLARYRPLPVVSIGMELEGTPSITVDSYGGVRAAVAHLIEEHGRRRLAFIRGAEGHYDAENRYRAYRDTLRAYGLPHDPELVSPPCDWLAELGAEAVRHWLRRGHTDLDAVVATSDEHASGALQALREWGIDVPGEVSVVGFNNSQLSRVTTPPLTTVTLRTRERGGQAVETLLALLAGEPVPEHVCLPTRLIVRQSCGCRDPGIAQAAAGPTMAGAGALREALSGGFSQALAGLGLTSLQAGPLLEGFLGELGGEVPGAFLAALERALDEAATRVREVAVWQDVVSALRRCALPWVAADPDQLVRAEDLWGQARVMIGERAQRAGAYEGWRLGQRMNTLRQIGQALTTVVSVPELLDVLAQELPQAGIPGCYLSLYEDRERPQEWSRLCLAYGEGGRAELPPEGVRFASRDLLPGGVQGADGPRSLVVQSLHFREEQLGFVVFEAGTPEASVYDLLSEQISSALWSTLLVEQNLRLYQEATAARQEAEEANRLKSLFLSTVSHELRTPLSLLVGLSQMMLRPHPEDALPALYREDLARIHVSAQQLDGLIQDVLDLARSQVGQLRLARQPLRLGEVLDSVALVGEQMARERGLAWRVEVPRDLPWVRADRVRLQQVLLNLVSNAVKFTSEGGVTLTAEAAAGEVTVRVSDTGLGVPATEQEAIFDEFRQSERTALRGYGGLGVGLALCRRLMELHGGRIGVESSGEEAAGSTFWVALPALDAELAEETARPRREGVLVLTGRSHQALPLLEYLAGKGFEAAALAIDEVREWQEHLLAAPPAAVVLGFWPAAERGWEVMRALKEHPITRDIPVLLCSLWQDQDSGSVLSLDYLTKPLDGVMLERALQRQGLAGEGSEGRTVLVVDDEPSIAEMHAQMARAQLPGCRVATAANGREALAAMRQVRPDLVLLDLMMPELDGFGVLEAMRESEATRDVPVIVLTAQRLTEEDMARLNQGVAAVLQKGLYSAEETLARIERALARGQAGGSETKRIVRRVMAYIHGHYAEAITRSEMAAYVNVSERHLDRCFRQETGVAPMVYLNRYRVRQAKELLEGSDVSIAEVALAAGFSDSNYFARVFRREVGVTPGAYRRGERPAGR